MRINCEHFNPILYVCPLWFHINLVREYFTPRSIHMSVLILFFPDVSIIKYHLNHTPHESDLTEIAKPYNFLRNEQKKIDGANFM